MKHVKKDSMMSLRRQEKGEDEGKRRGQGTKSHWKKSVAQAARLIRQKFGKKTYHGILEGVTRMRKKSVARAARLIRQKFGRKTYHGIWEGFTTRSMKVNWMMNQNSFHVQHLDFFSADQTSFLFHSKQNYKQHDHKAKVPEESRELKTSRGERWTKKGTVSKLQR